MTAWERLGAISGLVFVALYFVAFFGLQDLNFPPAGSASALEIQTFFAREQTRLALATVAFSAGWTAFLWFVASIRSPGPTSETVRRLEFVAACAGVLVAGLSLAGAALQAEIVLSDPTTNEATLVSQLALFDASGGISGITPILRAAFVGALSLVALRDRGLWRWLGWFGLLTAVLNVLGGIDFVLSVDWSLTGDPLFDLLAFLAWILFASVALLIQPREQAEA